jgi:hypothetical protein
MNIFKISLEPSYFKKVGDDLIYPMVFDYANSVFVLNPTKWSPNSPQITSKSQLDSEKTEFLGDLTVLAEDFQDSAWNSAGWNLADLDTDIQNFYDSNLIFEESSNTADNPGMNCVIVRKNIDGMAYTVVFLYVGNQSNTLDIGDESDLVNYYVNRFDSGYEFWDSFFDGDSELYSGTLGYEDVSLSSPSNPSQPSSIFFVLNVISYESNVVLEVSLTPFSSRAIVSIDITNYSKGNGQDAEFALVLIDQNFNESVASPLVTITGNGTYTAEVDLTQNPPLDGIGELRVVFSVDNSFGDISPSFRIEELRIDVVNT